MVDAVVMERSHDDDPGDDHSHDSSFWNTHDVGTLIRFSSE